MNATDPSTDPDLIRADGEGMIDRREHEHHPVNTDPPSPQAPVGTFTLDDVRSIVAAADDVRSHASQDEADSGVEEDARHGESPAETRARVRQQERSEEETYTRSYVVRLEISEREDAEALTADIADAIGLHLGRIAAEIRVEHVPGGYLTIDRSYQRRTS